MSLSLTVPENVITSSTDLNINTTTNNINLTCGGMNLGVSSITEIQEATVSTWTTVTTFNNQLASVAWSPELGLFATVPYVNTGSGGILTSPDGTTWISQTTPITSGWRDIIWCPELGLFVVVGDSTITRLTMTSPDGLIWTTDDNLYSFIVWNSLAWSPDLGIFSGVGDSGSAMFSYTGKVWSELATVPTGTWQSVTWSPDLGLFVAVSSSGGTNDRVMRSSDGIAWSITSNSGILDNAWVDVIWAPTIGLFCACSTTGTGNQIMTSPDGIAWTIRTTPGTANVYNSLAWSPSLQNFVVAVNSVTDSAVLRSNSDFSAYNQSTTIGTQGVSDITIVGQNIDIGRSANNVTIGEYASSVTIGSPGVPVDIPGIFMGVSYITDEQPSGKFGGWQSNGVATPHPLRTITNSGNINLTLDTLQVSGSGIGLRWSNPGYTKIIIQPGRYMFNITARILNNSSANGITLYNLDTTEYYGPLQNRFGSGATGGDFINATFTMYTTGLFDILEETEIQILRIGNTSDTGRSNTMYGTNGTGAYTIFGSGANGKGSSLRAIFYKIF